MSWLITGTIFSIWMRRPSRQPPRRLGDNRLLGVHQAPSAVSWRGFIRFLNYEIMRDFDLCHFKDGYENFSVVGRRFGAVD